MLAKIFIVLCGLFLLLAAVAIYQEYKPRHYNNSFDNNYDSNTENYVTTTIHYPTLPELDEKAANETDAPSVLDFDTVFNPQEFLLDGDAEIKNAFERYEIHTFGVSWFDAVLSCWRSGGRLATPDNIAEARVLGRLLRYTVANANITNTEMKDALYIGVSRFLPNRPWSTVEGDNLRFEWWLNPPVKYRFYSPASKSCGSIIGTGRLVSQPCRNNLIYACDMKSLNASVAKDDGYVSAANAYPRPLKLHVSPLAWADAQEVCLKEGASLAAPYVSNNLKKLITWVFSQNKFSQEAMNGGIFLGYNDIAIESSWVDLNDNRPSVDFKWDRGLADGSRAENCLVAMPSGTYDDVSCSEAKPFVCEKSNTLKPTEENVQYEEVEGLGSYAVHTQKATWWDAVIVCRSENASLVLPNSEREVKVLTELFSKSWKNDPSSYNYGEDSEKSFFVGVHDSDKDRIWRTIEGKRVFESGFNKWYSTYDIYMDKRCVLIKDEMFKAEFCERDHRFICKKSL